jgi:hypothetical protein
VPGAATIVRAYGPGASSESEAIGTLVREYTASQAIERRDGVIAVRLVSAVPNDFFLSGAHWVRPELEAADVKDHVLRLVLRNARGQMVPVSIDLTRAEAIRRERNREEVRCVRLPGDSIVLLARLGGVPVAGDTVRRACL